MRKDRWSPYLVGSLIGVLSALAFFIFHKMLGASTSFVRFAGLLLPKEHVTNNPYYQSYLSVSVIDWQVALVLGIVVGAFLARGKARTAMEDQWDERFKGVRRYIAAFFGGMILLFGARLAGGCTSGHAISGGMQLALSSWLFMVALFATAIPTALILYRRS